jgi:hypothetical protein
LEIGLDGFVLLVELGEVGDDVFDDVGVGEGVDLGFLLGVSGDAAYVISVLDQHDFLPQIGHLHKHARVLTPSMFIAQLPQIPSLQLRLNVRVGSTSFLILIRASNIIGPVFFRSRV